MNDLVTEIPAFKNLTHKDIDTWIHFEKGVTEDDLSNFELINTQKV